MCFSPDWSKNSLRKEFFEKKSRLSKRSYTATKKESTFAREICLCHSSHDSKLHQKPQTGGGPKACPGTFPLGHPGQKWARPSLCHSAPLHSPCPLLVPLHLVWALCMLIPENGRGKEVTTLCHCPPLAAWREEDTATQAGGEGTLAQRA